MATAAGFSPLRLSSLELRMCPCLDLLLCSIEFTTPSKFYVFSDSAVDAVEESEEMAA